LQARSCSFFFISRCSAFLPRPWDSWRFFRGTLGEQRALLQEEGMPVNAFRLLDLLYRRPFVHVNLVSLELDVSFATANGLVTQFEDMGLLDEVTGRRRDRVFRFRPYLRLFEDDESGPVPPETVQETEAAEPATTK
jgi:HTH DNA binding domain